jgi:hypothetical protein
MDGLREFLDTVRAHRLVPGHLRGLFHAVIGRRVAAADGAVVSAGLTWRELAAVLKQIRFDPQLVTVLGADPDQLSPRDRQRFWYAAIALARPDSAEASADADALAAAVRPLGYVIGPPPAGTAGPKKPAPAKPKKDEPKPKKKK